jgi:hypothetical protein
MSRWRISYPGMGTWWAKDAAEAAWACVNGFVVELV